MADTTHFEWKEEYTVKVKIFDEQHQKLIQTIDDLYQAILKSEGKEVLKKVFESLNEYAKNHFATEEKYFDELKYPEAATHKALHEKFKKDIAEMEFHSAGDDTPFDVLFFLENWWINHILDVDKKYSNFFNEHGLL